MNYKNMGVSTQHLYVLYYKSETRDGIRVTRGIDTSDYIYIILLSYNTLTRVTDRHNSKPVAGLKIKHGI